MAIILDAAVLSALLLTKASTDTLLVVVALVMMLLIFVGEKLFLRSHLARNDHQQV
jgi:hypothetical protein